jgi:hypothetical protein
MDNSKCKGKDIEKRNIQTVFKGTEGFVKVQGISYASVSSFLQFVFKQKDACCDDIVQFISKSSLNITSSTHDQSGEPTQSLGPSYKDLYDKVIQLKGAPDCDLASPNTRADISLQDSYTDEQWKAILVFEFQFSVYCNNIPTSLPTQEVLQSKCAFLDACLQSSELGRALQVLGTKTIAVSTIGS